MCHRYVPPTPWPSYITSSVQQPVPPILASASLATDSSFGQASSGTNTSRVMPSTVQEELGPPPAKKTKRASRNVIHLGVMVLDTETKSTGMKVTLLKLAALDTDASRYLSV